MDTSDDPVFTPILIGSAIGAGTAAATGGDIGKGAMFGAAGGAAGGFIGGTAASAAGGLTATKGALIGGALGGGAGVAASSVFGKKKVDEFGMPSVEAGQAKRTAEPVTQLSEQAKKTKRLRASMLTRDWGKPTLGYAGLLGG